MAKEVWLRASGPPARLELPGGEKFLLTGEPVKFAGDLAPFARRALQHCHGIEEWTPKAAASPEPAAKSKPPAPPAASTPGKE